MIDYDELKNRVKQTLRGFPEYIGISLLEVNDEHTKAVITINETHVNAMNIAHGGVVATLMDEVAGMSAFYHTNGRPVLTRSCTVYYLAPSFTGSLLTATGKIAQLGRHTSLVEVEVRDEKDTVISRGSFDMVLR